METDTDMIHTFIFNKHNLLYHSYVPSNVTSFLKEHPYSEVQIQVDVKSLATDHKLEIEKVDLEELSHKGTSYTSCDCNCAKILVLEHRLQK